jgi:hypothetical protein
VSTDIEDCIGPPKISLGEGALISNDHSHTGSYSVKLDGSSISLVSRIKYSEDYIASEAIQISNEGYQMHEDELPPHFGPYFDTDDVQSNKYLASFWLKRDQSTQNNSGFAFTYAAPNINIITEGELAFNISSPILLEASEIIDGWQKFVYTFEINQATPIVSLESHPISSMNLSISAYPAEVLWIDDFRIQPVISSMQSYVYDALNLRLMAILDDNNYATFYDYDEEGKLQRLRQETEKGIYTIKETRKSIIKR